MARDYQQDAAIKHVLLKLRKAGFEVTRGPGATHWDVVGPSGWYWQLTYQPPGVWLVRGSNSFHSKLMQLTILDGLIEKAIAEVKAIER